MTFCEGFEINEKYVKEAYKFIPHLVKIYNLMKDFI